MVRLISTGVQRLLDGGPMTLLSSGFRFLYSYLSIVIAKLRSPIEYRGVLVPIDNPSINKEAKRQFLTESWEAEEVVAVSKYFPNSNDFVELGGCTGFLSTYIMNQSDESVNGVVVEANSELIPVIRETRRVNDADFTILEKAYHSNDDAVSFSSEKRIGTSSVEESARSEEVPAINLREIITIQDLDSPVVVADIEGAEADLLINEMYTLEECCPLLIIEIHELSDGKNEEVWDVLRESSFRKVDEYDMVYVYENSNLYAEGF